MPCISIEIIFFLQGGAQAYTAAPALSLIKQTKKIMNFDINLGVTLHKAKKPGC